jgi:4-methyl-5(b-hydroxyethyl)-thiazole monophosphate biosynthesis
MIYIFLADGVAEMESVVITECLRRAGGEVKTVGVTGMTIAGARGQTLTADIPLSEVPDGPHQLLVLPGGLKGVENLAASVRVTELVTAAMQKNSPLGAICAAPSWLAEIGLLNGRTVTCHPSAADKTMRGGATVLNRPWAKDGSLVTGQGPAASIDFSVILADMIFGPEKGFQLAKELLLLDEPKAPGD